MSGEQKEGRFEIAEKKLEINISSEKDLAQVEQLLSPIFGTEAAAQCAFVLSTFATEDYANRCNEATQEFARRLARRYGDEESFFDTAPTTTFIDARTYETLREQGYRGNHHSVALLESKSKNNPPITVIFDLTYYTVAPDAKKESALVLPINGQVAQALQKLKQHYGATWQAEWIFDPKKKTFNFQDT